MTATYRWTGTIRKDGDGISAVLTDNFGFTITLTGQRTAAGYDVVGINGHVPEEFRVPWLDDAVDPGEAINDQGGIQCPIVCR